MGFAPGSVKGFCHLTAFPVVLSACWGRRCRERNGSVQSLDELTLLAAQTPFWDQVRSVPRQFWINAIICILAVLIVSRMWREMKKLNDYAPYFAAVIVTTTVFFYWVYNRTEPRVLSPLVDRLTVFFPTKAKHDEALEKIRQNREK